MANKHMPWDLAQMQSLPLEAKIIMTQQRIRIWYEHWNGEVYVSFSGGKDSSVLKHIVDGMYSDVPALFVNTGLEYPEIQRFVKDIKAGKYDCFNSDVEIIRPEMRFDEVITKHGYPVASKEVSQIVREAKIGIAKNDGSYKYRIMKLNGELKTPDGKKSRFNCERWKFLLDASFDVSEECCKVMKKKPLKKYEKQTKRYNINSINNNNSSITNTSSSNNKCNKK